MLFKKCAIYTRASSDEKLNQELTTLDVQREACLSYISSQKEKGWLPIREQYDDGGFSGGNMNRPALGVMLEDIKKNKIQIVVVYKMDRLTRSLADFIKMTEIFDQYGVAFISITQSFNTDTSMGRLTLNVLLSFAQYERELAGERIRDKIAASKRKGIWMGGTPPLGYEGKDRQLFIDEKEAELVNYIFRRFIELKNCHKLFKDLKKQNIKGRARTYRKGQKMLEYNFSCSALRSILKNPVYIGKIKHKDKVYQGHHEPIIANDLWSDVQALLFKNSKSLKKRKEITKRENFLHGKMFDKHGSLYIPHYTFKIKNKNKKKYRYYISKDCSQKLSKALKVLSAHEIEGKVEEAIRNQIFNLEAMSSFLNVKRKKLLQSIEDRQHDVKTFDLFKRIVKKVIVHDGFITVEVSISGVFDLLLKKSELDAFVEKPLGCTQITTPYISSRAHRKITIIEPSDESVDQDRYFNMPVTEFKNLVRGMLWRSEHFRGLSMSEIARREKFSERFIEKCIFKTFEVHQTS